MNKPPRSFEEVMARIKASQGTAKSASADTEALSGIKDPADKGTKSVPEHPQGDSKKETGLPTGEKTNTPALNDAQVPGADLKVSPSGKDVPSTENGNVKEDKATSPTVPVEKIAGIMERIKNLQKKPEETAKKEASDVKTEETQKHNDNITQQIEITPEFHLKLASEILATEEGVMFAERILQKSAGEQAARDLINAAGEQQYLMAKQAYEQELMVAAIEQQELERQAVLNELTKNASAEEIAEIEKIAAVHDKVSKSFQYDFEKAAYQAGAMDAAAMEDAMADGEEVPEEAEGPSIEEMLAILDEAVQAGEIDEQTAMAVAEHLIADAEVAEDGEEIPPEAMEAAAEAEKMASELIV